MAGAMRQRIFFSEFSWGTWWGLVDIFGILFSRCWKSLYQLGFSQENRMTLCIPGIADLIQNEGFMWQLEEWQQSCYRRTGELLTEVRGIDAEDFSMKHQTWWFFNIFLEAVITFENHWEAPTICFIWKVGHILESAGSCCKLSSLRIWPYQPPEAEKAMPSALLPPFKSGMSSFHWQMPAWNRMLKRIPGNIFPTLRV